MLSLSLHIDNCSILLLHIWLAFLLSAYWHLEFFSSVYFTWFLRPCPLLTPAFAFCIFHFTFFFFAYWLLQYFSSLFLKMLRLSLHYEICGISFLYIWLCFPCLCVLTSAVFQFGELYFAFLVSAYWHLRYLSSGFYYLSIFTSTVFQLCMFYFAFVISAVFRCLIIPVKITTFQHGYFYLLFHVSSDTTLIVKKLL